jgi:hypothetical protein
VVAQLGANDFEHRPETKNSLIIELPEKVLGIEDYEVEVEFQAETKMTLV